MNELDEHQLYFFGLSGDAAEHSQSVDRELKIKDLVEASSGPQQGSISNLQLKYPVCLECFENIIRAIETKIHQQEAERDIYMRELVKIKKKIGKSSDNSDEAKLAAELRMLEAEEQELDKQLKKLDEEAKVNEKEVERLKGSKATLENEDVQFWRDVNNYEKNLVGFQESLTSADALIGTLGAQYSRLKNTNILNEVFQIGSAEEIGTISGFRLGRLPTTDVKWEEINAALGQALYLLSVLAHRFSFKFEKYDIVLCGAFSSIAVRQQTSQSGKSIKYELYMPSSEDRYSQGLVFLLDAVKHLAEHVERQHSHLLQTMLPAERFKDFVLNRQRLEIGGGGGDLIGKHSIKFKSDDLPQWTKACKNLLTKLQHLILLSVLRDQSEQLQ